MTELIRDGLMLIGAAFVLLAAIGIVRLPDVFTRMSASAKAVTFGTVCLLAAAVIEMRDPAVTTRAILIVILFFLKTPVAGHAIARAAYRSGVPLWERTIVDEMREQEKSGAAETEVAKE